MKKLYSTLGESLIETLVALLITVLSVTMLVSMISTMVRVTKNSEKTMDEYRASLNDIIMQEGTEVETGTVVLTGDDGSQYSFDVNYYVNEGIGGNKIVTYRIRETEADTE